MDLELRNKRVVVTGASSGIGRTIALKLIEEGARVLAVGRRIDALESLRKAAAPIGANPEALVILAADLTDATAPTRIIGRAEEALGGIDGLVNGAGILSFGSLEKTTLESWDAQLKVNVTAVFLLMQAASAALRASKGAVVNISSVAGTRPVANMVAYTVSKAA